ncbi:MAG TPA: hypothetical protein VFY03_01340 [Woeseiaceae bacterium]|nr:hypothetical protein [Woeseiaceae bacterium]
MPKILQALIITLPLAAAFQGCHRDTGDAGRGAPTDTAPVGGEPTYRVRSDFEAPLNADDAWAGAAGAPQTVVADRPFRLRMEAEAGNEEEAPPKPGHLNLEYRHNGGDWARVEAHGFPYPLRELEIGFADAAPGRVPDGWYTAAGDGAGLAVAADDDGAVLTVQAGAGPLVVMYPPPWELPAFSFAAEYRVGEEGESGFGLVFGYEDEANHWLLWVDAGKRRLRLERVAGGEESVLAERPAPVTPGEWFETEVKLEDGELLVNFADDTLEFSHPAGARVPVSDLGFVVAAGGRVDFRGFVIEGEPRSPRVSIVEAPYANGAATTDVLAGSTAPFAAGAGVSLAEKTPPVAAPGTHTEIEWPLVIRKFADGAAMNESGDTFEFRMTTPGGRALAGEPVPVHDATVPVHDGAVPVLTLEVPAGHLGGTFVETPGRIGPWQAGNGDLYFIMEPAESDNLFMMVKSEDGGRSWREAGAAGRPATGDLESVDARQVGDTIHILHQVSEATRYHAFRTSDHAGEPDTWAVTDELATEVEALSQMASLVVRPDGSLVTFFLGDTVAYAVRSPAGDWSEPVELDNPAADSVLVGPQAVLGKDGAVHVAYARTDGTTWFQTLGADGALSGPVQIGAGAGTSEGDWGAVLPLVYLPDTDTVVVIYRLGDGTLWERRVTGNAADNAPPSAPVAVTDRAVVTNAVDSQQAAADAVVDADTLHVLFIDADERHLYATADAGGWQSPTLVVGDIDGAWVRGNVYTRPDGRTVYGYVYDAGSQGGAGFNRYGELELRHARP